MSWRLVVEIGRRKRRSLLLPATVGRAAECDLSLPTDPALSARHFRLSERGGTPWIEDLQSTNGTFLNGRRIEIGPLKEGDLISAGRSHFRILAFEAGIRLGSFWIKGPPPGWEVVEELLGLRREGASLVVEEDRLAPGTPLEAYLKEQRRLLESALSPKALQLEGPRPISWEGFERAFEVLWRWTDGEGRHLLQRQRYGLRGERLWIVTETALAERWGESGWGRLHVEVFD